MLRSLTRPSLMYGRGLLAAAGLRGTAQQVPPRDLVSVPFVIPEGYESVLNGTVSEVDVQVGDRVLKGQRLASIETAKANVEVESPLLAYVSRVNVRARQDVDRNAVVFELKPVVNPRPHES